MTSSLTSRSAVRSLLFPMRHSLSLLCELVLTSLSQWVRDSNELNEERSNTRRAAIDPR